MCTSFHSFATSFPLLVLHTNTKFPVLVYYYHWLLFSFIFTLPEAALSTYYAVSNSSHLFSFKIRNQMFTPDLQSMLIKSFSLTFDSISTITVSVIQLFLSLLSHAPSECFLLFPLAFFSSFRFSSILWIFTTAQMGFCGFSQKLWFMFFVRKIHLILIFSMVCVKNSISPWNFLFDVQKSKFNIKR